MSACPIYDLFSFSFSSGCHGGWKLNCGLAGVCYLWVVKSCLDGGRGNSVPEGGEWARHDVGYVMITQVCNYCVKSVLFGTCVARSRESMC